MSRGAVETPDEATSVEISPLRHEQRRRSTFGEPERLLITVLGSKVVYQVSAETFPPVTNLN